MMFASGCQAFILNSDFQVIIMINSLYPVHSTHTALCPLIHLQNVWYALSGIVVPAQTTVMCNDVTFIPP